MATESFTPTPADFHRAFNGSVCRLRASTNKDQWLALVEAGVHQVLVEQAEVMAALHAQARFLDDAIHQKLLNK